MLRAETRLESHWVSPDLLCSALWPRMLAVEDFINRFPPAAFQLDSTNWWHRYESGGWRSENSGFLPCWVVVNSKGATFTQELPFQVLIIFPYLPYPSASVSPLLAQDTPWHLVDFPSSAHTSVNRLGNSPQVSQCGCAVCFLLGP